MMKPLLILSAIAIMFASCKSDMSSTTTNCAADSLQQVIASRDTRINVLLDSLKMMMGGATAATTTDSSAMNSTASTNTGTGSTEATGTGKSFYKAKKAHVVPAEMRAKYPGEFPEGSARVLTEKDLMYLSEWGLKVMLNEIYARHGMKFSGEMGDHFNRQGWYRGTAADVTSKLSPTERRNIEFIKAYKFTPQIPA